jgi:hypothetical protein
MVNTSKYFAALLLLVFFSFAACKEDDQVEYEFPDPDEEPLTDLPEEWKQASGLMEGLPEGIEVYRYTTTFSGKDMNAYAVVFDPANESLEFKPYLSESSTRPSELFADENGAYVVINGGFFGPNVSYSLVQHNGQVDAVNIRALTRQYNGANATYYPTRGAFGLSADNTPEVTWMYNIGDQMYSYPAPSPNALGEAPQPQPSASFPEGGEIWNVTSAIGGSPVLIKNGEINITDTEELIAIDKTSSRARSAIGYTADGKIILLAVEGNNPEGGTGLDLQELAKFMLEMGCTGVLNLDGGGSTYMMVNGEETVKPSSGERAVMSVIFVKGE